MNDISKTMIIASGSRYDHIDKRAATENGVIVTHCPRHNAEAVAEFTITLIMTLNRKICQIRGALKNAATPDIKISRKITGDCRLLRHKVLGLIGFGRIARLVAEQAMALGMKVYTYDPYIDVSEIMSASVTPKEKDELLASADFVSLHVRMTDDTKNLISQKELGLMKKTAYIINTSRGGLVEEKSLYRALKERKIAGAALDVLVNEPPDPKDPLLTLDNTIITGHDAGTVAEAADNLVQEWWAILDAYFNHKEIPNLVNAPVRMTNLRNVPDRQ